MASKVSVASLQPADKDGWMTKQGGSYKSWKKRWFVLKGAQLFYFKTKKDTDLTGVINLTKESNVKRSDDKKKKYCFMVHTTKRDYLMYPDSLSDQESWMKAINQVIERIVNPEKINNSNPSNLRTEVNGDNSNNNLGAGAGANQTTISEIPPRIDVEEKSEDERPQGFSPGSGVIRQRLLQAKNAVSFLQQNESKVLEFWQIWSGSVPSQEAITEGAIIFQVATAADMEKLTWRTSGPQNLFIQEMVNFFWNVGAPETEIDRLNDVGALINPMQIGSWIDMSSDGGMDGGWFFPVDVSINLALEASDTGEPIKQLEEWCREYDITQCISVGRDMGAAPPRQTEIRLFISGDTFEEQLERALNAFQFFGFPELPPDMQSLIRASPKAGLELSVITSSERFVRLGLLCPDPSRTVVEQLCTIGGGNSRQLFRFESSLGVNGPSYAEYQYLMKGFGYGVYKEGFDVVFHYNVGEERALDE